MVMTDKVSVTGLGPVVINIAITLKVGESVGCSVVSDSLRPHGL